MASGLAGDNMHHDVAARAAWLHFVGGMTQSAVAGHLGIPVTRAHRMISQATRDGLVRVFVDAEVADCVALESALCRAYGLEWSAVAPDLSATNADPMQALSLTAARYLVRIMEQGEVRVAGLGHGRTMAAMVDRLPQGRAGNMRFVSLLGGLTRSYAANPIDVIQRVGLKTGAESFMAPAPLFTNTPGDRDIFLAQTAFADIQRLWAEAEVCIIGVGGLNESGSISNANVFDPRFPLKAVRELGAQAEVLGQFLDASGAAVTTPYDGRVIAADFFSLQGRQVVALAGGADKVTALDAALRSNVFTGLITDEVTARSLVDSVSGESAAGAPDNGGPQLAAREV